MGEGGEVPASSLIRGYPHATLQGTFIQPDRGVVPPSSPRGLPLPSKAGWGTSHPIPHPWGEGWLGVPTGCEQTENITYAHPSDAGGNDRLHVFDICRTLMEVERERKDSFASVSPIGTPRKRKDSSTSSTSTSRVKVIKTIKFTFKHRIFASRKRICFSFFLFKKVGPDGQIIIDEDEAEMDKENENEKVTEENDGGDEGDGDDSVPAPQVTIGADGQIVLNEARFKYVSQDLTFLYLVRPPYRSSRPMRWAPRPDVCGGCPLGIGCPWL